MDNVSNFMGSIYLSIFGFFSDIISIIFSPIDTLIATIIPDYTTMGTYISAFFDYFEDTFLWIISWFNIPKTAIGMILGYITFRIILFFGTLSFKLFVRWWGVLRP